MAKVTKKQQHMAHATLFVHKTKSAAVCAGPIETNAQ